MLYTVLQSGAGRYVWQIGAVPDPEPGADNSPQPVATTFLAATADRWYHPAGWNPTIFPHLDQFASVSAQIDACLSDLDAYSDTDLIPHAAAVNARTMLLWDGFQGQYFNQPISYPGAPEYYRPEFPRSSVQTMTAKYKAAGFRPATIVRPTEFNAVAGTQLYGPSPIDTYRRKVAHAQEDGFEDFYFDSSKKGPLGSSVSNAYFTVEELATLPAECEYYMEFWHESYAALPNVRAVHDPAPGYQPGFQENPAWDPYAIFYFDQRSDPFDPVKAAAMAASFARGARLFLYAGRNFNLIPVGDTGAVRQALYALWQANYPS